jgi:cytoskeleton protein RodZ
MTDRDDITSNPGGAVGGGALLQHLRVQQGLALEALAAMIKVAPAKLAALEQGRYQDLPDAAFTRALAMTVCRVLKVDASTVLAGLPQAQPVSLGVSEPNAVPFKAGRARLNLDVPVSVPWRELFAPRWLVPAGVLLAAVAVYFIPQEWTTLPTPALEAEVPVPAATLPVVAQQPSSPASGLTGGLDHTLERAPAASGGEVEAAAPAASVASAVVAYVAGEGAQPSAVAAISARALVLNVTESSWVEVRDAEGSKLLSRHLAADEVVAIDGTPPLSVKIGNVSGVAMTYKGNSVDLSAFTRANVARMELK